ncbi:MAG: hypothetical protein GWP44_01715 [Proteobacteria bacterium]|nr:hypothetical protein [Pseudomonadota bacterium]
MSPTSYSRQTLSTTRSSTISDRRYSDEEFALVVRKASELQQPGKEGTGGLTLADMKSVGQDVGIDAELIERAASLVPQAAADSGIAGSWVDRSGTSAHEYRPPLSDLFAIEHAVGGQQHRLLCRG